MRARMTLSRAGPVVFAVALVASACSSAAGGRPAAHVAVGPPALVDTIDLGKNVEDFALDAKRGLLYISSDDKVLVVDTATKKVTKTIHTGYSPGSVALDPELQTLYIVMHLPDTPFILNVIDTGSGTLKERIILGGQQFGGIAVDPSTHTVYVSDEHAVEVFDGRTDQQTATIPAHVYAHNIVVDPVNKRLYISHQVSDPTAYDGAVLVADTATNQVIADVRVNGLADSVAVVPDAHTIYVANSLPHTVSVIDGRSNTLSKTIKVNNTPERLGVDSSNEFVYVGTPLEVIDGRAGTVTAAIDTGGGNVRRVAVNPQTHTAYILSWGDRSRWEVGTVSIVAPAPERRS